MVAFGLLFGALSEQITTVERSTASWYEQMGGTDRPMAAFRTSMLLMVGMAVAAYVVQVALRMRAEEVEGRAEAVLATAVTRWRWVRGQAAVAASGAAILMVVFALAMGVSAGDAAVDVVGLCGAALVHGLGPLVLGGAVVAVTGSAPRWATAVGWGGVLLAVLLGPLFGPQLGAPAWLQRVSPFTSVPKVPAAGLSAGPVIALLGIGLALGAVGVVGLRRRDLRLPA